VLYWIKEYKAIILKREKFVVKLARQYFTNSTTADIFFIFELKEAEIEAYV